MWQKKNKFIKLFHIIPFLLEMSKFQGTRQIVPPMVILFAADILKIISWTYIARGKYVIYH